MNSKDTFGDYASIDSGYAFKSSEWQSEGYPVVKIKNIVNGVIDLDDCAHISEDSAQRAKEFKAQGGDILISLTGYVGQVGRLPPGNTAYVNQRVGFVRPKRSSDANYIFYLLQYLKPRIEELGTGTAQANVSPKDIMKLSVPSIPQESEQSIGEILANIDNKIAFNKRLTETLESIAQSIFKSWFIDFDPVHAKSRGEKPIGMDDETAALFPDTFEESELGMIPKGWSLRNIGSICETLLGGTPSRNKDEYWGGDIPWINSGKVNDFRITSASEFITTQGLEKSATKLLPKGTTVLAITGATLGQYSRLELESCANQSVVGILESDEASNEFIYLSISNGIERLISAQTGGAQQHINKEDVNSFLILYPGTKLMTNFTNFVKPMFAEIGLLLNQSNRYEEIRDALLPRLISGELQIPEEFLVS